MGNADYSATDGITGSLGPSLALRGIFNELTKNTETAPLYISPKLVAKDVCINPEDLENHTLNCAMHTEYFLPEEEKSPVELTTNKIDIFRPANGLEMAIDPRIPHNKQAFEMRLSGALETDTVEWVIDNEKHAPTLGITFLWPTKIGKHYVEAIIWRNGQVLTKTEKHAFNVK
jgi:penicillin-binding protein 1C